ncbi:flagellar hook-length control protein FliK [Paracoccaceae bacterium]|nr:flagellar hook-length control protein FliK [Paracoccaceae bacterium]
MSIANISSSAIDKLLSATPEEPPVGSKGAALFAKFSELLTSGAGADHGDNPDQKKLTEGESSNALQPGDEIDIVALLGFIAALEDQVSKTPVGDGLRASLSELSGEDIGLKDLAPAIIADPDFLMMRDKFAQATSALADDPQAVAVPSLNGLLPYLETFHRHSSVGMNKEPQTADALPVAKGALRLDYAENMVRTQHIAYPSEVAANQPMAKLLVPVALLNGEAVPHKNLPDPPEKPGSSKGESTPLKLLLGQPDKVALVSKDTQVFEPMSDKSAKLELGRSALAVTGLKENREQGMATPGPATPVKVPETDEVAPKSIAAQTADRQTDTEPRARAMHQIPQVEPEKISELRQRAADGSSFADLSKNNTSRLPSMPSSQPVDPAADLSNNNTSRLPSMPSSSPADPAADLSKNNTSRLSSMPSSSPADPAADLSKNNTPRLSSMPSSSPVDPSSDLETAPKVDSGKLQVSEGQQKEAVKPTNLLKPEITLKPGQIALRAASALSASSNDPAAPSKIKVALEASAPAAATALQKAVEAEFKPKPDVKGTAAKIQKPSEQGKDAPAPAPAPVTGAAAAALRQAALAAVAGEGGAEAAQDLSALPHSISPLNSASPQLAQAQTAPQTSGQLLDKWVDSHLDLNARGWTQTLARNVISALRTGQQQIALTLSPASLGKMHIAFGRNESGLDVKIQAERKATVSLFGESEGKIISSLETAGYRVTSLSCSVMQTSDENFNMNLGQGFNEEENPSGDERSQTAQKNEQNAGKEADDASLKGKGDQDGLVDITI